MTEPSVQDAERLDRVLQAVANPLRRALLERVSAQQATVSDLADEAGVTMPAISRHLRMLEDAGLIARVRRGRSHLIRFRRDSLQDAADWFARFRGTVDLSPDSLSDFVRQLSRR
ncbi:MAG: Transcriptional repressor SdpR [Calditrichaeota bacterium]|nr:Transcriptional repressor SdpR [Calditrichota bacterium]